MSRWSRDQGGVITDCRSDRLCALGAKWNDCTNIPLRFHVLNTSDVVAYSWPTGDVFCSVGLLNVATDQELNAAIAHELGHLLDDSKARSPHAVGGCGSLPVEELADSRAVSLLKRANIPPDSLITLLGKVSEANRSQQVRAAIQTRIQHIREAEQHS